MTFCHKIKIGTKNEYSIKCKQKTITLTKINNKNNKLKKNKKMNIKPLGARVVIKVQQAETQTKSGIYIPDSAKEKPQQGIVIAVGNGKKDEPMELKVNDKVLFGKYAGTSIELDGEDLLILNQSDVLAVI